MFVTAPAKSTRGYTMLQLFVSDKGFVAVYPIERKSQFHDYLQRGLCSISLVVDTSGEETSTHRVLEDHTPWANRAELYFGFLKKAIRKDLRKSNCPMVLWDYCSQRRSLIHNLTPRNLFQLEKCSPFQMKFGVQGDISNLSQFDRYDWFSIEKKERISFLIRKNFLGVSLDPLRMKGMRCHNMSRRSVRLLLQSKLESDSEIRTRDKFTANIIKRLGDFLSVLPSSAKPESMDPLDKVMKTILLVGLLDIH